jgi:hypothetical protein
LTPKLKLRAGKTVQSMEKAFQKNPRNQVSYDKLITQFIEE